MWKQEIARMSGTLSLHIGCVLPQKTVNAEKYGWAFSEPCIPFFVESYCRRRSAHIKFKPGLLSFVNW